MPAWIEIYLTAANPYFYPFVFLSLYASGLGMPISADLVFLSVGYIAYQGQADYKILVPLAISAIMATDATMFWIARKFGRNLISVWPFRKVITPERLLETESSYHHYGYRMIFLARFMPGIRTVFVFAGGLLRLNLPKFMLYDFLGGIIAIPCTIYSVKWVAGSVEMIHNQIAKTQWVILTGLILVVLGILIWKKSRSRQTG